MRSVPGSTVHVLGVRSRILIGSIGVLLFATVACSASTPKRSGSSSLEALDSGARNVDGVDNAMNGSVIALDGDAGAAVSDAGEDAGMSGCGDGKLQAGEACDDRNDAPGDGCSADCKRVEQDFICPAPGEACVSSVVCGDGRVSGRETCDDGNQRKGDGCDDHCLTEAGFTCQPGAACTAAKCGDRIIAVDEQCEDDNAKPTDGDGCSASCKVEPGFICPKPGAACQRTVCNDGKREGSEACDDGNQVVGDGCTPFCQVEPNCDAGACKSRCGDGLILPDDQEQCDDGNTQDNDGCSSDCTVERGYSCVIEQSILLSMLTVPVTFRDVIALPTDSTTRHPDFEIFTGGDVTPNLVMGALGSDDKPVYTGVCDDAGQPYPSTPSSICPFGQQTTNLSSFNQWYRDMPGISVTKVVTMTLALNSDARSYSITNAAFFPWDNDPNSWVGQGKEQASNGHDYGFTTEILYYFEYQADDKTPQMLSFSGDDDIWVFINHRLAVDIGGSHRQRTRSVTLDDATATQLGIESGKIYEIKLFHAERHTPDSDFNLTLDGFVSASSHCSTKCGDGIVSGAETCDDGKNDGGYGSCTSDCQRAAYCGDGRVERDHEACDDRINITTYNTGGQPGCAPGCKLSAYCGDKQIDSLAGEECDDGQNTGAYGGCTADCHLAARCGDGQLQSDAGEECDDGNLLSGDGCGADCKTERPR